ncbi:protein-L-isoaspartate(D-aspartate) O-methyltransferase [Vibrio sp. 10N.261.46.E12]|uniref:protein-L-isoaspartate(D-aspartate) O-methyltransferase n=1 Tax=unclassified Vibrio TaxID=2614977 RepID=UPI000977B2AC|nr:MULTISPECIES: protein-L-isoaspartate(D-aspartate) O-methyltransferase [unclassified Vibrio]OMO34290.1 protein-L-isoaspartate O-methyltransferase [Vibrio sp. 10N.261.45.E1]PMJ20392.1 protein-L-isoaspartate O-methyltransferase [Vibrio sp. 10N.286.45.B6]PML85480.1 protein-L-isoaspartate O-methyltransferase [Vibrio sp. 10N.261.49.E11]PMM64493.1 protein-L-isoaspartate O-methyltransferase [Vibrio sp. 10N.261.46.F12]PMM89248.1 protein-L-isoaspartate O-methyltransferase [Vibrio sp. 10N.261.46.E8]
MSNPQAERLITFLIENGIQDQKVLDAIYQLPRESFLSQAMYHQAYDNNALPIGQGQTISQPYIVAKMTELLELQQGSRVLEIGTGSGYQTAVLAQLVDHVYSVERIKSLQWDAKRRLKQLDFYNISTKHGDGWQGWSSKAPFDAIIVTAAAESIPQALLQQLRDGGRLLIPVGDDEQQLLKIVRHGDEFLSSVIEMVRFVPLVPGELA